MEKNTQWFNFIAKTPWVVWIALAVMVEFANMFVFGGLGVVMDEHHHHALSNIMMFICYTLLFFPSIWMFNVKSEANKKMKESIIQVDSEK
jgi:predicted transporter